MALNSASPLWSAAVKDLEARLTRLEQILPSEGRRLMALWWKYADDYLGARLHNGDVEAAVEGLYRELSPEDAAQVIALSDESIADLRERQGRS